MQLSPSWSSQSSSTRVDKQSRKQEASGSPPEGQVTGCVQASDKARQASETKPGARPTGLGQAGRSGGVVPGVPWPHSACSGGVADSPQGWGRRGGCRASAWRCPAPTTGPSQSSARCGPGRWPPTGRSRGWGVVSCSGRWRSRFPWRQASCEKAGNTGHHPLTIDWGGGPGLALAPQVSQGNLA